jgi:DNA ligase-associated metallophosphoesterase
MPCVFETTSIVVNGETLLLDPAGALYWPAREALILADLHFEKGSSFARRGIMLPPYDTHATLNRIMRLFKAYGPRRIIALGDSFHDGEGPARLDGHARDQLAALAQAAEWFWIEGNHDPEIPLWLGGYAAAEIAIGNLVFRHEPAIGAEAGEIAGHLHPCASISRYGHTLRRRCFVADGYRLVMPSFGAFTGGLNVRDAAFQRLFSHNWLAYALGGRRVYAVAGSIQVSRRKKKDENQPSSVAINTVKMP